MKKIIYSIILVAIFGLVYAGCSAFTAKPADVASVEFYVDDGNIPADLFSISSMKLSPAAGKDRTLSLEYSRTYPKASGSAKAQNPDVKNNGVVGGDFYDRYEEMMNLVFEGKLKSADVYDASTGVGQFAVIITFKNGKVQKYDYSAIQNDPSFDTIKSLFIDLTNLFSQDVY